MMQINTLYRLIIPALAMGLLVRSFSLAAPGEGSGASPAGQGRLIAVQDKVDSKSKVQARVLADVRQIARDRTFIVAVELTLSPEWHVYWSNPGDSGLPTTLTLDLPEGFTADPARLPAPSRYILPGDVVMYGYEKSVIIGMTVHAPIKQPLDQPVTLTANVQWLACNQDICTPGKATLPITLQLGPQAVPDPDTETLLHDWWVSTPTSGTDSIINSKLIPGLGGIEYDLQKTSDNTLEFSTKLTWSDPAQAKPGEWFPAGDPALVFAAPKSVQSAEKIDGRQVAIQVITTTATILQGQTPATEQLGVAVVPDDKGIRRSFQTVNKIPHKWRLFPWQGK